MARVVLIGGALAVSLTLFGCRHDAPTPPRLDWLQGDWHGVRRDGDDGTEAPMTVHVTTIGDGVTQVERLEVQTGESPYIGFAVHAPTGVPGEWSMLYTNATRESFSRLVGKATRGERRSSRRVASCGGPSLPGGHATRR